MFSNVSALNMSLETQNIGELALHFLLFFSSGSPYELHLPLGQWPWFHKSLPGSVVRASLRLDLMCLVGSR